MPAKRNAGEALKPFEFRPVAAQMPPFRGMFRRGDPASIPPTQFHLLINARTGEGEMSSRPGLTLFQDVGAEGCITGMWNLFNQAIGGTCYPQTFGTIDLPPVVVGLAVAQFNSQADPFSKEWQFAINGEYYGQAPRMEESGGMLYLGSAPPFGLPAPPFYTIGPFQAFLRWKSQTIVPIWEPATNGDPDFRNHSLYLLTVDPDEPDELSTSRLVVVKEDWPLDDGAAPANGGVAGRAYIHSMCVRQERRDNPITGDPETLSVIYIGTADGKVLRYDGTMLETVFDFATVPVPISNVRVFTYFERGIVAIGSTESGFAYHEDVTQPWIHSAWPDATQGDVDPGYFLCLGVVEAQGYVVFYGMRLGRLQGFVPLSGQAPCAMRWGGGGNAGPIGSSGPPHIFWEYNVGLPNVGSYPIRAALLGGILWFVTVG